MRAAPSLDKGRFAFLANVPLIGRAYTHFNPAKKAELVNCSVGSSSAPIKTMDQLRAAFAVEMQRVSTSDSLSAAPNYPAETATLVIFGDHLEITQDPGILVLNPRKLILVGARIVHDGSLGAALDTIMITRGWNVDLTTHQLKVIEARTVQDALLARHEINPATSKLVPTIYSVRA